MGSYIPSTLAQRQEMLAAIGMGGFRELYRDVPESVYLDRPLDLPAGMSELEVSRAVSAMAAKNRVFDTVLRGAGAYDTTSPVLSSISPPRRSFSPPTPPTRRR